MKQLSFEVNGQYIKRSDDLVPVAKSRNYFYAHFDFKTPEWTGTKTALFQLGNDRRAAVLDDNGDCLIPWEFFDTDSEAIGRVSVYCGELMTTKLPNTSSQPYQTACCPQTQRRHCQRRWERN